MLFCRIVIGVLIVKVGSGGLIIRRIWGLRMVVGGGVVGF